MGPEDHHPPSFERFYADEFRGVLAYLIARTGDRWVAEELAQETFSRAYRNWEDVRDHERPGAWARTVAHNLAMSRFRRLGAEARAMVRLRGMRMDPAELGPVPVDEEFWEEVRRLPERQSQAVMLHYLEDLPVATIADVLGCTQNTAKVHLHRGRRRLAERLQLDLDGGVA
ncbi:MAG: RNA polymerase sigma factor [Actinobacteria bacterium]|nr:RNA polymerase sigma factor [Actinomycetota bacterium]